MGIILGVVGALFAVWLVIMVVGGIVAVWAGQQIFSSTWWADFWGAVHWIGDHLWFIWIPMVIVGVVMKLAGEQHVTARVVRGTWRVVTWPVRALVGRARHDDSDSVGDGYTAATSPADHSPDR